MDGHGHLVAIEGISGSGKSFLAARLETELLAIGLDVLAVGGFEVRERSSDLTAFCRHLVNSRRFVGLPLLAEVHLLVAELVHDIEQLVVPHLAKSGIVVFDGYWESLVAYERARARAVGRHDVAEYIGQVVHAARSISSSPSPTCTVYIACAPEIAAKRLSVRDALPVSAADNELQALIADEYETVLPQTHVLRIDSTSGTSSSDEVKRVHMFVRGCFGLPINK